MSHLQQHIIEEAAPVAGQLLNRNAGQNQATQLAGAGQGQGLIQNLVGGIAPGAGAGREFHVHPQQQNLAANMPLQSQFAGAGMQQQTGLVQNVQNLAGGMLGGKKGAQNLGTYVQEKETFITGAPQQQVIEQPIIREQHVHVQNVQPRVIQEGAQVIRHDERDEFRKVQLGQQLLTHSDQTVVKQVQEAPLVTQKHRDIIHEHHKNVIEEKHKDVIHEHHKNVVTEHIQPVIHEQHIREKHVPIIHESEKEIIHEKHIPIIHESHERKIVEQTRQPIVSEFTERPIVTHTVEQPVVIRENASAIVTEDTRNFQSTAQLQRDFSDKVYISEAPTFGQGFQSNEYLHERYLKEGGRRHKFGQKCRHFGQQPPLQFNNGQYVLLNSGNQFSSNQFSSGQTYTSGTQFSEGDYLHERYLKEGGRRHKFGQRCRHYGQQPPLMFQDGQYLLHSNYQSSGFSQGVPMTTGLASGYSQGYTTGSTYTSGQQLMGGQQLGTTGLAGTGGQFIDQTQQKQGMGSKIKGAFSNIKTALIGDRRAADLKQEQIVDTNIMPTNLTGQTGTILQQDQNLMRHNY